MKLNAIIKLFLISVFSPVILFAQEKGKTILNAPIREAPSMGAGVVTMVEKGETVLIIDAVKYYYKVTYQGRQGYLSTAYVHVLNPKLDSLFAKKNDSLARVQKIKSDSLAVVAARYKDSLAKQAIIDKAKADIASKEEEKKREAQFKIMTAERHRRLIARFGKYYAKMIEQGYIQTGMSKSMVKEVLGDPTDVNRTVTVNTVFEQWVYSSEYGKTTYYYFQNGKLVSWQD